MEIVSVIVFGVYSSFVLNLEVGGYVKLNKVFTTLFLCVLFVASGYFLINGIIKLDIVNIVIGNLLLWGIKLFKF